MLYLFQSGRLYPGKYLEFRYKALDYINCQNYSKYRDLIRFIIKHRLIPGAQTISSAGPSSLLTQQSIDELEGKVVSELRSRVVSVNPWLEDTDRADSPFQQARTRYEETRVAMSDTSGLELTEKGFGDVELAFEQLEQKTTETFTITAKLLDKGLEQGVTKRVGDGLQAGADAVESFTDAFIKKATAKAIAKGITTVLRIVTAAEGGILPGGFSQLGWAASTPHIPTSMPAAALPRQSARPVVIPRLVVNNTRATRDKKKDQDDQRRKRDGPTQEDRQKVITAVVNDISTGGPLRDAVKRVGAGG